jgi:hypothetical protein
VFTFALMFGLTVSAAAFASVARWTRYTYGVGSGHYGGAPGIGNSGVIHDGVTCSSVQISSANNAFCPIPDGDTVISYTGIVADYANANPTQPVQTCINYNGAAGGTCTTYNGPCNPTGACEFTDTSVTLWNEGYDYKYAVFENLTSGALFTGYKISYNSTL